MCTRKSFGALAENYDLLRSSPRSLDRKDILQAFLWLRDEAPYPPPTSIHLDLTLRCSARCLHCKQWAWPGHSEFTIDQLRDLLAVFTSWGVKTITFGGGNPLLHDHADLAIQMADEANIHVGIISEGVEMTNTLADSICKHSRWIRFSLDGPDPDIHDKIRNAPGIFNQVMENIRRLRSRRGQLRIGLNCVIQKSNLKYLSSMISLAEHIGVDVLLFKLAHGEDYDDSFLLSTEELRYLSEWAKVTALQKNMGVETNLGQLIKLFSHVFSEEDATQGKPIRSFYIDERVRCFAPFFSLACDSEGNMYPCCYLQADTRSWRGKYDDMRNEFCLGNIFDNSQQILNRLSMLMREQLHELPASGYDECGCCTRFCQINAALSRLYCGLSSQDPMSQTIAEHFTGTKNEYASDKFL